jgi:hypothetical protein
MIAFIPKKKKDTRFGFYWLEHSSLWCPALSYVLGVMVKTILEGFHDTYGMNRSLGLGCVICVGSALIDWNNYDLVHI